MVSLNGWLRLEPLPLTHDLETALRAEVADPLWLLARQWQLGEFAGEDGGSPVMTQLQADVGRISRFHPGPASEDAADAAADRSVDYIDQARPLEVLVEQEPVRAPGTNSTLAADAGLHFARLLRVNNANGELASYLDHYRIPAPVDDGYDPDGQARISLYADRVIDGQRLQADLVAHRGDDDALTSLPPAPAVTTTPELLAAANRFLDWWDSVIAEPADAYGAWKPNRLEYGFACSARMNPPGFGGGGQHYDQVVLHADEYRDGHLDWYSFRASAGPQLGTAAEPTPVRTVTRTVIPTPVTYSGQPSNRFWGFEDGSVSFGRLNSGRGDVGRFLLAEFALLYGDDWFIVPIDMDVGSVASVRSLTVTDTFGVETDVPRSAEVSSRWNMFSVARDVSPYIDSVFVLAPTVAAPLEGEPLEEVALFRDEMANMVWGVERRILSPDGAVVDRYAEHQATIGGAVRQTLEGGVEDAEIVYRLASTVPRHWIPFVPVPADGGSAPSAIKLEQRAMQRFGPDGVETILPRGQVLQPDETLTLEEEEVPRSGAVVRRNFQMTRWTDGSRHVWLGRRVTQGRGEGASGLRFDFTEPA